MKAGYFWLLFFTHLTYSLIVAGDSDWPNPHDDKIRHGDATYTAHCTSYCDIYGYYEPPKICYSPSMPVYCCGDEHSRFCCLNGNYSVGDQYPDVSSCANSGWWLFHWRVIIGLLGTLMAVLMASACCYYCCLAMFRDKSRRRARRQNIPAVSAEVEPEPRPRLQPMFDPESPYAFTPPDYNSLPKQPPDYNEIMQAYANAGFFQEEENRSVQAPLNEPPPKYEAPSGAAGGQAAPSDANGGQSVSGVTPNSADA